MAMLHLTVVVNVINKAILKTMSSRVDLVSRISLDFFLKSDGKEKKKRVRFVLRSNLPRSGYIRTNNFSPRFLASD